MRLADLSPVFLRYEERLERDPEIAPAGGNFGDERLAVYHAVVPTLAEAQGIRFLCPACFAKNGGPVGTHQVVCWSRSRGAPERATPGPGRWTLEGTGFDDLTLNGDSPSGPGTGARSVLLIGGCAWHGFVTNGEVT